MPTLYKKSHTHNEHEQQLLETAINLSPVNIEQPQFTVTATAPKKTLPHKKRITKKLKSINQDDVCQVIAEVTSNVNGSLPDMMTASAPLALCSSMKIDTQPSTTQVSAATASPASMLATPFSCELCGLQCTSQLDFFSHLKQHYEPVPEKATMPNNCLDTAVIVDMQLWFTNQ